jgi:hypothetical protein
MPSGHNDSIDFLKRREVFYSSVLRSFPTLKQPVFLALEYSNLEIELSFQLHFKDALVTHPPAVVTGKFLIVNTFPFL